MTTNSANYFYFLNKYNKIRFNDKLNTDFDLLIQSFIGSGFAV